MVSHEAEVNRLAEMPTAEAFCELAVRIPQLLLL